MICSVIQRKEKERMIQGMQERFGFPERLFAGYDLIRNPKEKVFLAARPVSHFVSKSPVAGLPFTFSRIQGSVKPTTVMIQMFGKHATRNCIDLTREEAIQFMKGTDLEKEAKASDGYVILKYRGEALGVGLKKGAMIKNQIPSAKRLDITLL